MDITKMLAELRAEREAIEQAIMVLERVAAGRGKRRGRPPAWMSHVKPGPTEGEQEQTEADRRIVIFNLDPGPSTIG